MHGRTDDGEKDVCLVGREPMHKQALVHTTNEMKREQPQSKGVKCGRWNGMRSRERQGIRYDGVDDVGNVLQDQTQQCVCVLGTQISSDH
jgi:hypothetical protein